MTNRTEKKFYSKSGFEKYIVRKNYNGKFVHVVKFEVERGSGSNNQFDTPHILADVIGENGGLVYDFDGSVIDELPTTGKYRYTLKEVCESVQEMINDCGYYL